MRLPEFQQYLKQKKIALAFFVHPDPAITYFTQRTFSYAYLLITPIKAVLYVTKLDSLPKLSGIVSRVLTKNWSRRWKTRRKIIVGVNKELFTLAQKDRLRKLFPRMRMVDVSAKLGELRMSKTPDEVRKVTKACSITTDAFAALVRELPKRKLKTEREAADFLDRQFRDAGAEPAFPTIVAMGKNAAIPHHVPDNTKLGRGFLVIDFGAKYQNYCADMTRTIYLGKPSVRERKIYELVQDAQQAAIDAVKEGTLLTELDKTARKRLGKYSSRFIHSLGHGIGIEVHEAPSFRKGQKIQRGMVFTVEPGIYVPGKFGIRIEDTLVFDGKVRILTKFGKRLVVIP